MGSPLERLTQSLTSLDINSLKTQCGASKEAIELLNVLEKAKTDKFDSTTQYIGSDGLIHDKKTSWFSRVICQNLYRFTRWINIDFAKRIFKVDINAGYNAVQQRYTKICEVITDEKQQGQIADAIDAVFYTTVLKIEKARKAWGRKDFLDVTTEINGLEDQVISYNVIANAAPIDQPQVPAEIDEEPIGNGATPSVSRPQPPSSPVPVVDLPVSGTTKGLFSPKRDNQGTVLLSPDKHHAPIMQPAARQPGTPSSRRSARIANRTGGTPVKQHTPGTKGSSTKPADTQ